MRRYPEVTPKSFQHLEDNQEQEPTLAGAIRRRLAPLGDVKLEPHPPVEVHEDGLGPYLASHCGVLADIDPDLLELRRRTRGRRGRSQ